MAKVVIDRGQARITAGLFARRRVERAVNDIVLNAKIRAGQGPYATGRLARSITSFVANTPLGVQARVGSDLVYAGAAEGGARKHVIRPRTAKALYFYWRKVGQHVLLSKVNHPGMRGKHYLRESLIQAGRRHGFRVRIYER